jgi:hypothetical protein
MSDKRGSTLSQRERDGTLFVLLQKQGKQAPSLDWFCAQVE